MGRIMASEQGVANAPYIRTTGGVSELTSMGVQAIYEDPVGFFQKDPEHFRFTLEAMYGAIPAGYRIAPTPRKPRTPKATP